MRRALTLAALALLAVVPAAHADYGTTVRGTAGVVAYWPLDEPSSTRTVTDAIASRSATFSSGATLGKPAGIDYGGTSAALTGTATASFGNVAAFNFSGDRTLEAWVAPTTVSGDRYILSKGTTTAGYHLLLANGGVPAFQVNATRVTGPALAAGGWHHIVGTLAARAMTLYVDGHQVGTATLPGAPANTTNSFYIGRNSRTAANFFNGGIDELAMYSAALDGATVAAHFAAGADTTAPHTVLAETPGPVSSTPDGAITFSGSKGGLTFTCALDGAAGQACSGSYAYDKLRDGTHTLVVYATDRWGTVEDAAVTYTWQVALPAAESAPPVTTFAQAPAALSNTANATFTLSGSKTKLTWLCSGDGGAWTPCVSTFTLTGLKEGTHSLKVKATDRWGVVEDPPATFTWTIDLTAPETFVVATKPTKGVPAVGSFGSEAGASFECRLGDGDWVACPATGRLPFVTAPVQLAVRAVDAAGNVDPSPATIELDPVAPGASVLFSGGARSFLIGGNRSVSGLQCSLDGAQPGDCPWPLDFTGLAYGAHQLTISDTKVTGIVFPTIRWTDPLPAPRRRGQPVPGPAAARQPPASGPLATSRLPRMLFQSNASGTAKVRLPRKGKPVRTWNARVVQGSNLVRLPRAVWLKLRPGDMSSSSPSRTPLDARSR